MKKIEIIAENKNYSAINIGSLNNLPEHSLIHPGSGQEIKGKVFVKDACKSTGTEISFSVLNPKQELPYFHIHKEVEETYIFLKGSGYFQVDNDCFPVTEGSLVRIAPQGARGLYNPTSEPLVYVCIQSKVNSLEKYSIDDGERVEVQAKWRVKN